jgi:exosortase A
MTASWRTTFLVLTCTIILLVAAYWPTAQSMAQQWLTSTYSHAGFILPISLYLAWRIRGNVQELVPRPSFWVLFLVPVLGFAWFLGELTSTAVIQHFFFVAMIVCLIWGEIGTPAARVLVMPLAFLFFAVPMGDSLIPILQDFSAWFAIKLLDLTRVPALLEGRFITIPNGKWEVAEACSGIRFLLASLTIGFVYATITYRTLKRRVAFLVASAVIPILANGLRVYGIILTDYLGGARFARSADHIFAGWLFVSVIMVLLFLLGKRWREEDHDEPIPESVVRSKLMSDAAIEKVPSRYVRPAILSAVLGLGFACAAPLAAELISRKTQVTSPEDRLLAPQVMTPWLPSGNDLFRWQPAMLAANTELFQSFVSQEHIVKLYVAYYETGRADTKLVSSANYLFDRFRWQRTAEENSEAIIDGNSVRVHQTAIRSNQASLLLWSWYWADGQFTSNPYQAKWFLVKSKLAAHKSGSAIIVVATEEHPGDASAPDVLRDFVSHLSLSATLRREVQNVPVVQ